MVNRIMATELGVGEGCVNWNMRLFCKLEKLLTDSLVVHTWSYAFVTTYSTPHYMMNFKHGNLKISLRPQECKADSHGIPSAP